MNNTLAPQKTLGKALFELAEQGLRIKIRGNCMAPLLNEGDSVDVRRRGTYKSGEVLVLRLTNGQLVTHRLLGMYRWRGRHHFMTRPDNGKVPDGAVTSESIVGKVMTTGCGRPMPAASPVFRCQLLLSFFYCLCRRMFAKLPYT